MKKVFIPILLLLNCTSQSQLISTTTSQISNEDIFKLKVDSNTFEYSDPIRDDEAPFFSDERKYNFKSSAEGFSRSLIIEFDSINLNTKKGEIELTGHVQGGWYGAGSEIQVFIGVRVDTVSNVYFPQNPNLSKPVAEKPIDIVSAFFLKDYVHARSELRYNSAEKRYFKIISPIQKKSILVFGQSSSYSEVFEIGKLLTQKK